MTPSHPQWNNECVEDQVDQHSQQDQEKSPAPSSTSNKHPFWLPTVLAGIFMMLLGLGIGYILFSDKVADTESLKNVTISPSIPTTITLTQSSTQTWKTFQQEDDKTGLGMPGFSIQYPPAWIKGESSVSFQPDKINDPNHIVTIFLTNDPLVLPQDKKIQVEYPAGKAYYSSYKISKDKSVSTAIFYYKNYAYAFSLTTSPDEVSKFEPLFKQILQTLTFNNNQLILDKKSWKKYVNNQVSMSFLYPESWEIVSGVINPDPDCKRCGGVPGGLYVTVVPNPKELSVREFAMNENRDLRSVEIDSPQPPISPTIDIFTVSGAYGGTSFGTTAYIKQNKNIIKLKFDRIGDNTANAILSTIKFEN